MEFNHKLRPLIKNELAKKNPNHDKIQREWEFNIEQDNSKDSPMDLINRLESGEWDNDPQAMLTVKKHLYDNYGYIFQDGLGENYPPKPKFPSLTPKHLEAMKKSIGPHIKYTYDENTGKHGFLSPDGERVAIGGTFDEDGTEVWSQEIYDRSGKQVLEEPEVLKNILANLEWWSKQKTPNSKLKGRTK